ARSDRQIAGIATASPAAEARNCLRVIFEVMDVLPSSAVSVSDFILFTVAEIASIAVLSLGSSSWTTSRMICPIFRAIRTHVRQFARCHAAAWDAGHRAS